LFEDLDRLIKKVDVHAVTHIVVPSKLAADSFTRFLNLLALPTSHLDDMREGKLAGRFCANSGPGIERRHVARSGLSTARPSPSEMMPASTHRLSLRRPHGPTSKKIRLRTVRCKMRGAHPRRQRGLDRSARSVDDCARRHGRERQQKAQDSLNQPDLRQIG
jgi:hypothetical protein